jgi:hypothetical protein
MDVTARLRNAADRTERIYQHGYYDNYVEALRLCAEFNLGIAGRTDAEILALKERLLKLACAVG